jgi:hypothetical protein
LQNTFYRKNLTRSKYWRDRNLTRSKFDHSALAKIKILFKLPRLLCQEKATFLNKLTNSTGRKFIGIAA